MVPLKNPNLFLKLRLTNVMISPELYGFCSGLFFCDAPENRSGPKKVPLLHLCVVPQKTIVLVSHQVKSEFFFVQMRLQILALF